MREIPKKNYLILVILSIVTVVISLSVFNIYSKKNNESYISQNVLNASGNDIESLLLENNVLFVYIDSINNIKNKEMEKELIDELSSIDLKKYFVFYDNKIKKNINYFSKKYKLNIKKKKMLIVFEDGVLVKSINLTDNFKNEVMQIVISMGDLND